MKKVHDSARQYVRHKRAEQDAVQQLRVASLSLEEATVELEKQYRILEQENNLHKNGAFCNKISEALFFCIRLLNQPHFPITFTKASTPSNTVTTMIEEDMDTILNLTMESPFHQQTPASTSNVPSIDTVDHLITGAGEVDVEHNSKCG